MNSATTNTRAYAFTVNNMTVSTRVHTTVFVRSARRSRRENESPWPTKKHVSTWCLVTR